MNEELLNNYKLLSVAYGSDNGLVSLVTGDLLACAWNHQSMHLAPNVPCCVVHDADAARMFGEEHTWGDVISYLQTHYDWKNKNLP